MSPEDMLAWAAGRFGDAVLDGHAFRGDATLLVRRERLIEVLAALRDEQGFAFLSDLSAADHFPEEPRLAVVYHLTNLERRERVRVKTRVTVADPAVPSATALWGSADWFEREVYDLFGVRFDGHPGLTRILMPDDWEGHPARRDYPLTEEPVEFKGHVPKVPSEIIPHVPPRETR